MPQIISRNNVLLDIKSVPRSTFVFVIYDNIEISYDNIYKHSHSEFKFNTFNLFDTYGSISSQSYNNKFDTYSSIFSQSYNNIFSSNTFGLFNDVYDNNGILVITNSNTILTTNNLYYYTIEDKSSHHYLNNFFQRYKDSSIYSTHGRSVTTDISIVSRNLNYNISDDISNNILNGLTISDDISDNILNGFTISDDISNNILNGLTISDDISNNILNGFTISDDISNNILNGFTISNDISPNEYNLFYDNINDIEFNISPSYISENFNSYKHKVYYINVINDALPYSSLDIVDSQDIVIIQEQQYNKVKNISLDINVFKYKPLICLSDNPYNVVGDNIMTFRDSYNVVGDNITVFRSGRYSIQESYQFRFDSLIHISDWMRRSYKTNSVEYYRPTSAHILNSGGQGSGHDIVPIPLNKRSDIVTKQSFVRQGIDRARGTTQSGISGRHVSDKWTEIQIVKGNLDDGNLSDFLIEFDYVDWALSRNGSASKYNFIYEINMEEGDISTRLPDYLKIENNNKVVGRILRNEDFLKRYSFEGWVQREGHLTDGHDINTKYLGMEHSKSAVATYPIETIDSLPVKYPAIDESAKINTYKVSIKGVNATASIIEILAYDGDNTHPESDGILSVGDTIRQGGVSGIIIKILQIYTTKIVISGILDTYTIYKYLVDDIFGGIFKTTSTKEQKIYDLVAIYDDNGNLLYYTSQQVNSIPIYVDEYVDSTDVLGVTYSYKIITSDMDEHRGITKYIDLYLPVRRNFSYDRDKFLITTDKLPDTFNIDGKILNRHEWLLFMREQDMYGYDNDVLMDSINTEIKYNKSNEVYKVLFNDIEYSLSGSAYRLYLQSLIPNGEVKLGISESEDISPFNYGGIEITEVDFYNVDESIVKISGGGSYARGM